jgi:hypothetical protein
VVVPAAVAVAVVASITSNSAAATVLQVLSDAMTLVLPWRDGVRAPMSL